MTGAENRDERSGADKEQFHKSLVWNCVGCGFYQFFQQPELQPAFCKICGCLEMRPASGTDSPFNG